MAPEAAQPQAAPRRSTRNANGKRPAEDEPAPQEGGPAVKKTKTTAKKVAKPAVSQKASKSTGKGKKAAVPVAEPEPEPESDAEEVPAPTKVHRTTRAGKKAAAEVEGPPAGEEEGAVSKPTAKGKKAAVPVADPEPESESDAEEGPAPVEVPRTTRAGKKAAAEVEVPLVGEEEEAVPKRKTRATKKAKAADIEPEQPAVAEPVTKSKARPTGKGKQPAVEPEEPADINAATKPKTKSTKKSQDTDSGSSDLDDPIQDPEPQKKKAKPTKPSKKSTKAKAPAKPKAVKGTVHDPTTPKSKLPAKFSAHRELRIDHTLAGENHTLITHLQVLKKKPNPCTTQIEAEFWIDNRKDRRVGEIVSYLIDKTKAVKNGNGMAWVGQYLVEDAAGGDSETAHSLRELYTAAGQPKAEFEAFALGGDKILYLDSFLLDNSVQGTGLSGMAMQAFHSLLPVLPGSWAFRGTVVLSPAKPESDEADVTWAGKTPVEVERILVRVYESNGYAVWIKGDEEVEGSITVMGIEV